MQQDRSSNVIRYYPKECPTPISQERIIEKETLIKIEEKLPPDFKNKNHSLLNETIGELRAKLDKKNRKIKSLEEEKLNLKITFAEQKVIVQTLNAHLNDHRQKWEKLKKKYKEAKDLIKSLQNLDLESQLKGEIDQKLQKLMEERFSVSRASIQHDQEPHENLFQAEQQTNVLYAYNIQNLEKKLKQKVVEIEELKQKLGARNQSLNKDSQVASNEELEVTIREQEGLLQQRKARIEELER